MSGRPFTRYLFQSPSVASGEEEELRKVHFEFQKKLGDGAFGQVWRVRHKVTQAVHAIKQVPKDKVIKMLPQFQREVYIMYELTHPHIVKLYNHFEDERNFYLIMEHADGGNLFHKLYRERQFLERVAAQYFREVVLAVEYLHMHVPPIIHRDIKPENILLDAEGRVKLTDFGWSNYYSDEQPRKTVCGTLEYLPPEMVEKRNHDTTVDIWCLGVLLYEMLVGYTPFKANAKDRLLSKQLIYSIAKSIPKFPNSFPALAKDLVSKMLCKDLSQRPSIQDIKDHAWLREHPPLRETISQEIEQIPLPEIAENGPVVNKGYKVINQNQVEAPEESNEAETVIEQTEEDAFDSDLSFSDSDQDVNKTGIKLSVAFLDEIAYKESISKVEGSLKNYQSSMKATKESLVVSSSEMQELQNRVKELTRRIEEEQSTLQSLKAGNTIILSQVSDKNLELEHLSTNFIIDSMHEKISNAKSTMNQLQQNLSSSQDNLQSHQSELQQAQQKIHDLESLKENLQHQLNKLNNDMKSSIQIAELKLQELRTNAEVLKSRLGSAEQ